MARIRLSMADTSRSDHERIGSNSDIYALHLSHYQPLAAHSDLSLHYLACVLQLPSDRKKEVGHNASEQEHGGDGEVEFRLSDDRPCLEENDIPRSWVPGHRCSTGVRSHRAYARRRNSCHWEQGSRCVRGAGGQSSSVLWPSGCLLPQRWHSDDSLSQPRSSRSAPQAPWPPEMELNESTRS